MIFKTWSYFLVWVYFWDTSELLAKYPYGWDLWLLKQAEYKF